MIPKGPGPRNRKFFGALQDQVLKHMILNAEANFIDLSPACHKAVHSNWKAYADFMRKKIHERGNIEEGLYRIAEALLKGGV